eukprot:4769357-Amphidinium_carterae.1
MTAWRTGIRHLSRDASLHGCRILALLDSQVVSCSIQKGRSTSHRLNTLLQSIAGTCLLSKQSVIPLWISSKSNAADDPTRVSRVRDAVPDSPATLAFWKSAQSWTWPLEATWHEWRRRGFDVEYDQTLGFPGEGPRGPTRRVLAAHAAEEIPDLRVSVQPITAVRYGHRLQHFSQ